MIPAILAALGEAGAAGGAASGSGLGAMASGLAGSGGAGGGAVGKLTSSLGALVNPMKLVETAAGKLYKSFNALPETIIEIEGMITSTGRNWVNALAAPIDTVKQLGDAIGRFTSLSNPGGMKMLEFRINNAMATIGNILQPILDALTRSAEKMGDMFARLKPALAPAIKGIEELIDFLATRFVDTVELAAPVLKFFSEQFLTVIRVIEMVERPITKMIRGFIALRDQLQSFLGIKPAYDKNAKSDFAVHEPRYASAEDIFREQAKNALMSSMSPPGEEKKDVPSLLEMILTWLRDNLTPDKIAAAIAGQVLQTKLVEQVKEEVGGALDIGAKTGSLGIGGLVLGRW